ncbi:MAG: DsrE family protein [Deltaproteobacteria bacterium]|nr:DsrE family protein [Deltaproteobacteria bacterium]
MKFLFVLNDAPYGVERPYNALRLAGALARSEGTSVRVFLMGDAASAARQNQKVPGGYYNVENMLGAVVRHHGAVGVCGTCMDARGISADDLADGAERSSLDDLSRWTLEADKVLVF